MTEVEKIEVIKVPRFDKKHGFVTSSERSNLMSRIKGKNTSPEIILRKYLWNMGIRYRLHNKQLPGNPDIVIKKYKLIIFIDGEFWHGFNWEQKKMKIKTNRDFWIPKIERNMQRDNANNINLANMGYKVFRFWEQDIKKNLNGPIAEIVAFINSLPGESQF